MLSLGNTHIYLQKYLFSTSVQPLEEGHTLHNNTQKSSGRDEHNIRELHLHQTFSFEDLTDRIISIQL
jgi:hypothetical protein